MNAPGRQFDEEQDVEPPQLERGDGKKVALEDARSLLPEELSPARLQALRRRLDFHFLKDPPDGARGELDPEPDQLALDPPVTGNV